MCRSWRAFSTRPERFNRVSFRFVGQVPEVTKEKVQGSGKGWPGGFRFLLTGHVGKKRDFGGCGMRKMTRNEFGVTLHLLFWIFQVLTQVTQYSRVLFQWSGLTSHFPFHQLHSIVNCNRSCETIRWNSSRLKIVLPVNEYSEIYSFFGTGSEYDVFFLWCF